jgi:hypothetical protein
MFLGIHHFFRYSASWCFMSHEGFQVLLSCLPQERQESRRHKFVNSPAVSCKLTSQLESQLTPWNIARNLAFERLWKMLGNVLPEISGRGEGLLASPVNALSTPAVSAVSCFTSWFLRALPPPCILFPQNWHSTITCFASLAVSTSTTWGERALRLSVFLESLWDFSFAPWAAAQVLLQLGHGGKLFAATLAIESRVWSDVKTERAGAEY